MVQFLNRAEIVEQLNNVTGMEKILLLRSSMAMDKVLELLGPEEKDSIASMWLNGSFNGLTYGMRMQISENVPECQAIFQETSIAMRVLAASMWKAGSFSGENWNKGLLKL